MHLSPRSKPRLLKTMEHAQSETVRVTEIIQFDKFTCAWAIEHFSSLDAERHYSDIFTVGGHKWRLLIFPKGNNVDYLSIYLDVPDSATLPHGCSKYAEFSLAVVNLTDPQLTIRKGIPIIALN
uniref:MATH domain-containing protein n=1 Tax=Picea sitchensis TaxID=3332 RepID=A9NSM8_PICSI|nr:unknown [Picea sitchensis]